MNRNALLIGFIVGIILISGCIQHRKEVTNPTEEEWTEIKECIMGVQVDYSSGIMVEMKQMLS